MKTLIVGKNSFIGKSAYSNINNAEKISYQDIDKINLKDYNVILNCSIMDVYKNDVYSEDNDVDIKLARLAEKSGIHYIMISTRKVYGISNSVANYNERSDLNPSDRYSENKLITEFKIKEMMDSYTILRPSNVFGYEPRRKSFMGFCMNQLIDSNKIVYDISANTIRDFIDVDTFTKVVNQICQVKAKGLYNVGSNIGLSVGDVSKYLIKGYGSGNLIADSEKLFDQFILDNTKIKSELGINIDIVDFEKIIVDLGSKLYKDGK
jgi:dTDP-4-dehydrorhamnose reductase